MDQRRGLRPVKKSWWTRSSGNHLISRRWDPPSTLSRDPVSCRTLLIEVHNSGACSKSHSKPYHDRRTRPFVLLSQHKTCRSTREISVALQDLVGTVHFGGLWMQIELRTNAVENLLAAS